MLPTDILSLIETGGAVMVPLLACSVISIGVILERSWAIRMAVRRGDDLQSRLCRAVDQGAVADALAISRHDPSPLASLFHAALGSGIADEGARDRLVHVRHMASLRALRRNVWLVGTIGSLAPFIGLLGTVVGIVRAFENMAATGSGGFAVVAAGISEALIATAGGLLVGVASIFAYNAFNVRISNVGAQWRESAEELRARAGGSRGAGEMGQRGSRED